MFKKIFGDKGEHMAARYLAKKGYTILDRNVRTPFGEVDIVARKEDVVAFVEVKRRKNDTFGRGYESVSTAKQRKILHCAQIYCQKHNITDLCRFDVISIDGDRITHLENAFGE